MVERGGKGEGWKRGNDGRKRREGGGLTGSERWWKEEGKERVGREGTMVGRGSCC